MYLSREGGWRQQAKLVALDGASSAYLGFMVAVSGDGRTVLVGATSDGFQGAAYVFERGEGGWSQQAKLVAADGSYGDDFGINVALSEEGDTALIGARGVNGNRGAAYVFVRGAGGWSQQTKLLAADGSAGDYFGGSLSLSGDGQTALINASDADVGR